MEVYLATVKDFMLSQKKNEFESRGVKRIYFSYDACFQDCTNTNFVELMQGLVEQHIEEVERERLFSCLHEFETGVQTRNQVINAVFSLGNGLQGSGYEYFVHNAIALPTDQEQTRCFICHCYPGELAREQLNHVYTTLLDAIGIHPQQTSKLRILGHKNDFEIRNLDSRYSSGRLLTPAGYDGFLQEFKDWKVRTFSHLPQWPAYEFVNDLAKRLHFDGESKKRFDQEFHTEIHFS